MLVVCLLAHGADINARDSEGRTPRDVGRSSGLYALEKAGAKRGAELND